jgi:hypothetical protein
MLVKVKVFKASPTIEVDIPFLDGDLQRISQYVGRDVIWKAQHLRPYVDVHNNPEGSIRGLPTPILEDVKLIQQFLNLVEEMVVALIDTEASKPRCVGMGIIEECSPKSVWFGILVPYSFFGIVRVKVVNSDYRNHAALCKTPSMSILGQVVGHGIL